MAASFPTSVKSFSTLVDGVDSVLASHQNDRALEITAIENYLIETPTEKTVSGGVLTVDKSRHKVQPQSGTADDIDTITGMPDGSTLILYASDAGTDTLTLKNGTGNLSCFGGSDIALSRGFVQCFRSGSTVYVAGGGGGGAAGLTNSIASVTTSNVTAVAGTRHILDVSGMTANRNFVLPAGVSGDEIEVNISTGDDTYALIIIGDTGISINGGTAATEWSRLFISGETVRFIATSTSNWQIVSDKRIPCVAILERQAAQSINNTTITKIALDTVNTNRGNMGDVTTNDRINIRRTNIYNVAGFVSIGAVLDNQEFLEADLYKDGALYKFKRDYVSSATSDRFASPEVMARGTFTAGTYFELYLTHNEGAAQNTDTTYYPTLAAFEIL